MCVCFTMGLDGRAQDCRIKECILKAKNLAGIHPNELVHGT